MLELYCYLVFGLFLNQAIYGEPKSYKVKDMPLITVVDDSDRNLEIVEIGDSVFLEENKNNIFYRQ